MTTHLCTWTTPDFPTLPKTSDVRFRMAGSRLVDDEQYRLEGWEQCEHGYWRISPEGCQEYVRLKDQRRAERKEAWQERESQEQAFTDWVNTLPGVLP